MKPKIVTQLPPQPERLNRLTFTQMSDMEAEAVARLSVDELAMLQDEIATRNDKLKKAAAKLAMGLGLRYAKKSGVERKKAAKDFGIVTIADEDYLIKCDVEKKVTYDQEAIHVAMDTIPDGLGWSHYAKVKVEVGESIYKAAPPVIQKIIDTARTVTPGTEKYVLVKKESGK